MPNWTLYEGDCLEIMRGFPSESVDVVITDPPYGVRKSEAWDNEDVFRSNITLWMSECLRVSRAGVLWFCADRMLPEVLKASGSRYQRLLIWEKPPGSQYAGAMRNRIWYSAEIIVVVDKSFSTKGSDAEISFAVRRDRTVPKRKWGHPTTKPLDLMRWLVRHYSNPGDTILDPFAGSGTTLQAAVEEGRNAIGIEREPEYCEIIRKRMAAVQQPLPFAK